MQRQKFYRLNERITAEKIRLIDAQGKQIGILGREEALRKARKENVDLVEIASSAQPPVVKLVDFKKFLYQEEKKKRAERKKAKVSETKEIRLGPFTDEHDLKTKVAMAGKFLKEGDKLRIVIKFAGRQIAHPEFGRKIIEHCIEKLASLSRVEREPHFEGKLLIALLTPLRKGKLVKDEDKKINSSSV